MTDAFVADRFKREAVVIEALLNEAFIDKIRALLIFEIEAVVIETLPNDAFVDN